jgi:hypothetical protein
LSILRPNRSTKVGVGVAAIAMLALLPVVSAFVVRWCPRGADCQETSQILFGIGIFVAFLVSLSCGFVARDIADRITRQRPR